MEKTEAVTAMDMGRKGDKFCIYCILQLFRAKKNFIKHLQNACIFRIVFGFIWRIRRTDAVRSILEADSEQLLYFFTFVA